MTLACGDERGTPQGVYRHRKAGEPLCDECRATRNRQVAAYQRKRRQDPMKRLEDRVSRQSLDVLMRQWIKKNHPKLYIELKRQARVMAVEAVIKAQEKP